MKNDEQIANFSADKLSSIADAKPCSGKSQNLIRASIERLSRNRGKGWHGDTIKAVSANQLLMIIEFATFNLQEAIGTGVINVTGISGENCSINTGGTSHLGNSTGNAIGAEYQTSMSYRGMENTWGNVWKLINGINEYMDSNSIFHAYICVDCEFAENKKIDNYKNIGYILSSENGNISAFGYSNQYDWLFIPSETKGTTQIPVGDYYWCNAQRYTTWRSFPIGGG